MKISMKKVYSLGIVGALLFSSAFVMLFTNKPTDVYAQCTADSNIGNLYGYATTSNGIGNIYMSTDSWNDPIHGNPVSTVDFSVSYDRQTETWSGRGWNENVGWVDFGEINAANIPARTAEFESVKANQAGWGFWNPTIYLENVSYVTDPGEFVGIGYNGDFTSEGDATVEEPVGAGLIDFSNVQIIESPCNEYVDVTLNNVNVLYQSNCPISAPTIRWATTGVVQDSCEVDAGLWQGGIGASKPNNDYSGELATGGTTSINSGNTPQVFRLKCERQSSPGNYVYGSAFASCGEIADCPPGETCVIDPTTGVVIPVFKEV